jgi:hypothetical protein
MHFDKFSFGTPRINASTYEQDVVIECGEIRKRKKAPSKRFRDEFGHTPLSMKKRYPGVPAACDRHRNVWSFASYERSET